MAGETAEQAQNMPAKTDWRAWLDNFRKPGLPQIGIMAGVAAALALGIALALWSTGPSYDALYRGLAEADAGQIMEALQKENIPFKVDRQTGALMVPEELIHEARLKLASQGLPRGAVNGLEALDKTMNFGVSQFMENARYQHALEGELARSIMSIGAVQNARVHLALPKETVFVRNRQPPSASVLVQLHPGRVLDEGQVAAIVHLVSSSVPKLSADQVSVIDQMGNLLTRGKRDAGLALSLDQLDYTRRLEERYIKRIEDILTPILGMGKVRAQVALDVDFTVSEETAERFDPKQPPGMMRSEQIREESSTHAQPMGIPGALTNQPPGVAEVPEVVPGQEGQPPTDAQLQADGQRPLRQRHETIRNYELDKRISHIRNSPGRVQRISAAVVVDDRMGVNEAGNAARMPISPEELERITALVKEAVGFDGARGDSVNVMNATFADSPFVETPLPLWQQPWLLELVKWAVIGLVAILVLFTVVRPVLRRLLPEPPAKSEATALSGPLAAGNLLGSQEEGLEGLLEDRVQLGNGQYGSPTVDPVRLLDKRLKVTKALVAEDPKRAVQIIKNWISTEE